MKAYDEYGREVIGSLGEMVVEKPMPSMPIYFWNDEGDARYRASYFEQYPGKWRHGDWIKIFENGSLVIQGRSDATLNRKGVRIGTAEIYAILDGIPGVRDTLVLNLEKEDGGDLMPLFVVLEEGVALDDAFQSAIRKALREEGSPRHGPDLIELVPDIPYTLSGKKMEVPVKKVLMGMGLSSNLTEDAMRNPEAMTYFVEWAER
jgi:acetoacetyl-CoA synthetase